ncbi:MAG: hypothetical protein U0795_10140 [Pirellulales bacterium]
MKRRIWMALIGGLVGCGWGIGSLPVAYAKTIYTGQRVRIDISPPTEVGSGAESLWNFTLTLVGLSGARIGGWDGSITGPLHHQTTLDVTTPTQTEPLAGVQLLTDIDTHFLAANGQILSVSPPYETYLQQFSKEPTNAFGPNANLAVTRLGDQFGGTFALLGGPLTSWDVAQVVAPQNAQLEFDFYVGFGGRDAPPREHVDFSLKLDGSLQTPSLCGDIDADQDVDSADLLGFLANWTGAVRDPSDPPRTFEEGDCDGDTDIDSADMLMVLEQWTGALGAERFAGQLAASMNLEGLRQSGTLGAAASVPEPASQLLGYLGGLALWAFRRRR